MLQPLQEAYYFFKKNLWAICLVLFPLLLPVLLVQRLLNVVIAPFLKTMPWLTLIPTWVDLIARPFYTGALVFLLASLVQNKPWNIRDCYRVAVLYWPPLFLLMVYCNIVTSIGFLAFIVPGLWLFSRYAFVNFVAVLQKLSFASAIQRSVELSLPYRAAIMVTSGLLLLFTLLFYVGSTIFVDKLEGHPVFAQGISFVVDLVGFLILTLLDILLFRFFCLATSR